MNDTPIYDRLINGPRDPFREGRQVAVIGNEDLTAAIPAGANRAIKQWMHDHAESLAIVLAPYGLHPNDICAQLPARRVVYLDEIPDP